MKEKKTSAFSAGLIWFGAAVSIAEILTGTLLAPLGLEKGTAAILLGHAIGCVLLFLAGLIGANTGKSSMETVKMSFGQKGSLLFSTLNVLQLIGWTAVMIYSGASAAGSVVHIWGDWAWSIAIGALIIVWILIGIKNLDKVNVVTMGTLFVLTIILSMVIFRQAGDWVSTASLSFGAAVELSVAMPLSWLPLISDYTRTSEKPVAATISSSAAYFFASSWMYMIGMGAAIFTGESDIAAIMIKAGLGVGALLIIVFSTVTTTFLDAYSAGVSSESISKKLRERPCAITVCVIGTLLAIFTPITRFEEFLYLIGSVFAPMIAIQITDYFILHKDSLLKSSNWVNLALWLVGFVLYRCFMLIDTPIGNTVPVMIITGLLCIAAAKITGGKKNA
ncbi:MAG: putative hydroxymethylpyrimidine transporter CytX [Clostridiaceae bacterium]|nr:putative hydroxymethylpyrimidine transporter CytX [Clostridiaceae bacterium]